MFSSGPSGEAHGFHGLHFANARFEGGLSQIMKGIKGSQLDSPGPVLSFFAGLQHLRNKEKEPVQHELVELKGGGAENRNWESSIQTSAGIVHFCQQDLYQLQIQSVFGATLTSSMYVHSTGPWKQLLQLCLQDRDL